MNIPLPALRVLNGLALRPLTFDLDARLPHNYEQFTMEQLFARNSLPLPDALMIIRMIIAAQLDRYIDEISPVEAFGITSAMDSLDKVELALRVEQLLGIPIYDEGLDDAATVAEVAELLAHRSEEYGVRPAPALVRDLALIHSTDGCDGSLLAARQDIETQGTEQ